MEQLIQLKYVANAIVFSILGIIILALSFLVYDKLTPGNFWKEIIEEHNVALAIIAGAMTLSIAQIIASAIHG